MYSFLMADDEEIIRRGFSERIDWSNAGFAFLPPARDGREAIASVKRWHPDVVLTDINMPGIDGLEVCAFVAEHYPEITLVILSGYDEFEYARKAVTFRVFEYVLKPINARKLGELLERLKEHLDREHSFRSRIELLTRQAEQSCELIRERLLNQLVNEKPEPGAAEAFRREVGSSAPTGWLRTILIDPDDPESIRSRQDISYSLFLLAIQNCSERAGQPEDVIFQRPGRQIVVILTGTTPRIIEERTTAFVRTFYHEAREIPYSSLTLGISTIRSGLDELFIAFRESELAVDYRFIRGRSSAHYYSPGRSAEGHPLPILADDSRTIARAIKSGADEEIGRQITIFFNHLRASAISVYRSELEIQKYFIIIINALEEVDISCSDLSISSESDPILTLKEMKTLEESEAWLLAFCRSASEQMRRKRHDFSEKKVYEAIDHLQRNFSQPDLSTEQLSEKLAISAGYLSRIFKKHTNTTILEYLMHVRVDHAKELAKTTDLKNYEIAEAVGYSDAGYFGSIFRKNTGMTLSEYRHGLERDQE